MSSLHTIGDVISYGLRILLERVNKVQIRSLVAPVGVTIIGAAKEFIDCVSWGSLHISFDDRWISGPEGSINCLIYGLTNLPKRPDDVVRRKLIGGEHRW